MERLEVGVTTEQRARLVSVLGSEKRVDDVLGFVLLAGANEALAYATGEAVFSSMADLRMYRVARLVDAGLPLGESEDVVAALFKVQPTTARRMILNALARYSVELNDKVADAVRAKLEQADSAPDDLWQMTLPAGFVKDTIMAVCRASTEPNPTLEKGSVWQFPNETYSHLRTHFGLGKRSRP